MHVTVALPSICRTTVITSVQPLMFRDGFFQERMECFVAVCRSNQSLGQCSWTVLRRHQLRAINLVEVPLTKP